eukprot:7391193-Prymnesium_polylepis.1
MGTGMRGAAASGRGSKVGGVQQYGKLAVASEPYLQQLPSVRLGGAAARQLVADDVCTASACRHPYCKSETRCVGVGSNGKSSALTCVTSHSNSARAARATHPLLRPLLLLDSVASLCAALSKRSWARASSFSTLYSGISSRLSALKLSSSSSIKRSSSSSIGYASWSGDEEDSGLYGRPLSCSVRMKASHSAELTPPPAAWLLKSSSSFRDEVLSRNKNSATRGVSSSRCLLVWAAKSHGSIWRCSSSSRSSASSTTASRVLSSVSALVWGLAFARRSRNRISERRKNPMAPSPPVAARQDLLHRQCAGEARRGISFRSACRPWTHFAPFDNDIRSVSTREMPPLSLNLIRTFDWASRSPVPIIDFICCSDWLASMQMDFFRGFSEVMLPFLVLPEVPSEVERRFSMLTSSTACRMMKRVLVHRIARVVRSHCTKQTVRGYMPSMCNSFRVPLTIACMSFGTAAGNARPAAVLRN